MDGRVVSIQGNGTARTTRRAGIHGVLMNQPTKSIGVQQHNLILYKRALHPELFSLKARRTITHGAYELESWLMAGSHVLRFQHKQFIASELVTDKEGGLPTNGAVATFPCIGEKDYDHPFTDKQVKYVTTMQTESLSENLYQATYQEILDLGNETDALMHRWTGQDGGRNLSMLDLQRYSREVHAQSYHLIAATGLVLRTQTIFEHV